MVGGRWRDRPQDPAAKISSGHQGTSARGSSFMGFKLAEVAAATKEEILPPTVPHHCSALVGHQSHSQSQIRILVQILVNLFIFFLRMYVGYIAKCSFWHKGWDEKEFQGTGETDSVGSEIKP